MFAHLTAKASVPVLALLLVAPAGAARAATRAASVPHASACTTHVVGPASTATQLSNAITAAATERRHPSWAVGPTGARQGVVYFQPGSYLLAPITFTAANDGVRLVLSPGVKIRPAAHTTTDLFTLGTPDSQAVNVSVEAGDGCDTVHYAPSDLRNVWTTTAQRGNAPGVYTTVNGLSVAGMPNIPLGGQPGWPRSQLARMWVLDLDPAGDLSTHTDDFDQDGAGFMVNNAKGVSIGDVVS